MSDLRLERDALALFERLLEIPEDRRNAWLDSEAAERPDLLARVQAMLRADRSASMRTGAAIETMDEELPPERIGAYRISRLIGRGGMGSVYLGERMSGDFAHHVAIKVIKPGLLSEALVDRFQRERQTLANLSHPAIAQLHDGGETDRGSPYFIMEYVDGLPLLEWVDVNNPPRAGRQRLFRDICTAVAFAHRNLVVHRDLTPSNVLVTKDGAVKLIDFGIARPADEGRASEPRDPGQPSIGSLSLTPGYAAPERMTSREVTTAADIFSLGKLLARLVPPAPGDRDLRAIIARATALEPADRYPTADALSADVAAWRDGFPVAAAAGKRGYRIAKFVGRHRFGVAAATVGLLVILGALGLTAAAYARAENARRAEAARFEDLRSLARYMLFDLNRQLSRVAGNTAARVALANRAQVYLSALAASPNAPATLKQEAAQGLIALARVQGVPAQPNLGQNERARANLGQAIAILRALNLPAGSKTPDLVDGLAGLAMIQAHTDSDIAAATRSLAEAQRLQDGVPAAARTAHWHASRRRLRHAQLELSVLGQDTDAMQRLAALLEAEIAQWPLRMQQGRDAAFDRATAVYYRGLRGYFTDELDPAVTTLQRSEAMFDALDHTLPNDPVTLNAMMWNAYLGFGAASGLPARRAEAAHFLNLAVRTSDRLLQIEPNDNSLRAMAGSLRQSQSQAASAAGRHAEALAIQRQVLILYEAAIGPARRPSALNRMITAGVTMGNIARNAGDRTLACGSYRSARAYAAELERKGELVATTRRYVTGLDHNIEQCSRGAALSQTVALQ